VPIPQAVARFNRVVTNRVTGRVATYLPIFGVIVHSGDGRTASTARP
jgi:hypothetical protein